MEQTNHKLDFDSTNSAWVNERFVPRDPFDLQVEEISRNGYTILENCLSSEEIKYVVEVIDRVYDTQIKDIGSEAALIEIGEQGLARNLLQYDEFFLKMIAHKDVLALMQYFMGDYYILHQFNGNLNIPGLQATSTPWHRDMTFRDFTSSRPIALTAIWVVDEFNEANDGISVLPGTQKHDIFPSFEFVEKYQEKLFVKAGSVIVLDGMFFHRSGFNNSDNRRRVCQGMYTLPMIGQQICIPKTIGEKYRNDPLLRQILGYNSMQQSGILDWRNEKLRNKRKKLKDSMIEDF